MTTPEIDSNPAPLRLSRAVLFLLAAAILVATAWTVRWATAPPVIIDGPASGADGRLSPSFVPQAELDRLIDVYEIRIQDQTDSSDFRTLGYLYLEKARISGDISRFVAARQAFERAVELFPTDPSSRLGLASTDYGLHEFTSARDIAQLVYDATGRLDALAILVDATFALGEYDLGSGLLDQLAVAAGADQPPVLVRQSEWARIDGRADDALELARSAVASASESSNPRLRSWYQSFAAQMAFQLGEYEEGLELAAIGLDADPQSSISAIISGRLEAATGDYQTAIELYESVVDTNPDPTFLAELGDLYLLAGQNDQAEDAFATIEVAATLSREAGVYDRAIAQHLSDQGRDTARAVDIATGELENRHDVGAWDTLAWALYAEGQYDEAAEASKNALAMGTIDARFLYHAGMIAAARGDAGTARANLTAAVELSPQFQPLQATRARQMLASLE